MDIFQSILLGIVEGVTEFLPVSSTGHLILVNSLLKVSATDFAKSFEIIIQLGAISAVVFLYWEKLFNLETIKKLIVAFIPTGVIGLSLYKIVKTYLLGSEVVVLWSLFIGGIILVAFEYWYKEKSSDSASINDISYKQAVAIGFFQSIAIIPGISRSAATIVGGLSMGIKRSLIVEFSFLLAVPTMLAASGLDLVKNYSLFLSANDFWALAVGFLVSFLVALGSVKFLLKYIQKHNFVPFGIYRIVVSVVFWLVFFV